MPDADTVNVRYLVEDVPASVDFYTRHFGFTVGISSPAFADVTLGNLRLLLSGPKSSAGQAMTDGERPGPGGRNRIHDRQQLAVGGANDQARLLRRLALGIAEESDAPDGNGQEQPAQPCRQQKGQQVDRREQRNKGIAFAVNFQIRLPKEKGSRD